MKGFHIDTNKLLGEGQYPVYTATKFGRSFAAKHVTDKEPSDLRRNELVLFEMGKVHKNILQIETYCSDGENGSWIISQLCNLGNLKTYNKEHREKLKDPVMKLDIMKQITAGLEFLHSQDIVHRDIKPGNILVHEEDDELLIKITDFGEARGIGGKSMKSCVGTTPFAAPEIHKNVTPDGPKRLFLYNLKVDMYSLGLTFLTIIEGKEDMQPGGYIAVGMRM